MNGLSLFSGVGGMDIGLERAGVTPVAFCEQDPTAVSVLAHRWPNIPCHPDVTTLDGKQFRDRINLVSGGSPCQDLSVAGRRKGLDGERSGLFWHQCRIAREAAADWVLWENVYGALSSNSGADFAAVLWGLTGALPDVPNAGWRTMGVCVGPERTAVWRVFDAQWFGVAQRRVRVFVVAGPRGVCGPEILFEPESVSGDSRPSRTSGTVVAALTAAGVGTCGPDDNQAQAGHLIAEVANTLNAKRGCGYDGRLDRGEGNAVVALSENQRGELRTSDVVPSMQTGGGKPGQGYPAVVVPIGFGWSNAATQGDDVVVDGVASLRTRMQPAVAYPLAMRGRPGGAQLEMGEPDVYNALRAADGGSSRANTVLTPELAVRRLTPRECERLMGWPDDWTAHNADGALVADTHRYRGCGNGVVAPVAEWIGRRIVEVAA